MLRIFYTLLLTLLFPVILLHFWWRGRLVKGYRERTRERFGIFERPIVRLAGKKVIWVHAVSVGEVFAAKKLIQRLLNDKTLEVVVTTITPTGSDRVKEDFGDRVIHVYAPIDIPFFVSNFLNRVRPTAAIIIETELWPNILRACDSRKIPAIVANARLSERSAKGYKRFRGIARALFNQTTIIAAQNQTDGDRFLALGLAPEKLEITGSVKFDIAISDAMRSQAKNIRLQLDPKANRPILIAASTHTNEDEILLAAFKSLLKKHPDALLILVPRHPDNFERAYNLSREQGFWTQKRTQVDTLNNHTQVLIGDTMGELMQLFGSSDIAFIGGSLIERGGHNMIEAAAWQVPCLSGPHIFNFADISERLVRCGGMKIVHNSQTLFEKWDEWLCHPEDLRVAGENALKFVTKNQGALDKLMAIVERQIEAQKPS